MKIIIKLILLLPVMGFFYGAHAIEAPWQIQVVTKSDTSVELDWQDVADVLWYYIYYGETSGSGSDYDIEGINLIETSDYTLTDLSPETRYYVAITAVDDIGRESDKSPELELVTLASGQEAQAASLRIVEAKAVDESSVELMFSLEMESWNSAQREFIIENSVTGEEIGVDISDILPWKPKSILAILDQELETNTNYKITVLDIRDKDGNTIESGIDAFVNFTTPSTFVTSLEAAWDEEGEDPIEDEIDFWSEEMNPDQDKPIEISSEDTPEENQTVTWNRPVGNNAGTTISSEELSGNTLNAAAENEKLPQTWPEYWLLLLVAVMLWTWLFYKIRA